METPSHWVKRPERPRRWGCSMPRLDIRWVHIKDLSPAAAPSDGLKIPVPDHGVQLRNPLFPVFQPFRRHDPAFQVSLFSGESGYYGMSFLFGRLPDRVGFAPPCPADPFVPNHVRCTFSPFTPTRQPPPTRAPRQPAPHRKAGPKHLHLQRAQIRQG